MTLQCADYDIHSVSIILCVFKWMITILLLLHLFQDQYKVIFDSVLVFLESFDTYANFQNI